MWDSKYLIKIELGENIVQAANSKDTRMWLKKMFGSDPEDDAQLILDGVKSVREYLSEKNISLPNIQFTENTDIRGNEFICYWGIEKDHCSISNVGDLLRYIKHKAEEYGEDICRSEIQDILENALDAMQEDDIQEAYEYYIKAYYFARKNGHYYECVHALTDVSGIIAYNGQINFAGTLATTAIEYCNKHSIIDMSLKCKAYLNAGAIYKESFPQYASIQFVNGLHISHAAKNSVYTLFFLLELAEIHVCEENWEKALTIYKDALKIVKDRDNETAVLIQDTMIELYELVQRKKSSSMGNIMKLFKFLLKEIISNLSYAFIFKLLKIDGRVSVISIGTQNTVKGNIFNSPSIIGNSNTFNNYRL